jgi:hypothetical protein
MLQTLSHLYINVIHCDRLVTKEYIFKIVNSHTVISFRWGKAGEAPNLKQGQNVNRRISYISISLHIFAARCLIKHNETSRIALLLGEKFHFQPQDSDRI